MNGVCICKPNVIGPDCGRCAVSIFLITVVRTKIK